MSVSKKDREGGVVETDDRQNSRDEMFDLLSNHRRRYALHHLQRNDERADLGELSERIAAWENRKELREVTAAERKRVYTSLQQFHLPRMNESGVLEFDDRSGEVELGPAAENLDLYLEVVEGRDVPWSQYYLALTALNLVLLATTHLGVGPVAQLPAMAFDAFVVTTFGSSALVHAYYNLSEMRLGSDPVPEEIRR